MARCRSADAVPVLVARSLRELAPPGIATGAAVANAADVAQLAAEEREAIARAVPSRRREFATARACARRCIAQLGFPPAALPRGSGGEPLWPHGLTGSLTHKASLCAAAVARSRDLIAVGLDLELDEPLDDGVAAFVGAPSRLHFSAKESVLKAAQALGVVNLELRDIAVSVSNGALVVPMLAPWQYEARFARAAGFILTLVAVRRNP